MTHDPLDPRRLRAQSGGDDLPVGPTGAFPAGALGPDDAGEINVAVGAVPKRRLVLLHFGVPITWLGMTPEEAEGLADCLIQKARAAARGGR